jgi:hypothetical protein
MSVAVFFYRTMSLDTVQKKDRTVKNSSNDFYFQLIFISNFLRRALYPGSTPAPGVAADALVVSRVRFEARARRTAAGAAAVPGKPRCNHFCISTSTIRETISGKCTWAFHPNFFSAFSASPKLRSISDGRFKPALMLTKSRQSKSRHSNTFAT